jgi:hypothetical protein
LKSFGHPTARRNSNDTFASLGFNPAQLPICDTAHSKQYMNSFAPMLAAGTSSHALSFAWHHLTKEGFCTIIALLIVSVFSWTVIITKARQPIRARKLSKKFFAAYRVNRDPLDLFRRKQEFDGCPAFELYFTGAEDSEYHLKNKLARIGLYRALAPSCVTDL